jgi:hypothetical protein
MEKFTEADEDRERRGQTQRLDKVVNAVVFRLKQLSQDQLAELHTNHRDEYGLELPYYPDATLTAVAWGLCLDWLRAGQMPTENSAGMAVDSYLSEDE